MTFLSKLQKSRKHRARNKVRNNRRFSIERMEDRKLMAVDVALTSGVIEIEGTDYDDSVMVEVVDEKVRVNVSFGLGWPWQPRYEFTLGDVDSIKFVGKQGADVFVNNTKLPSVAAGGKGPDILIGGAAADTIYGGKGQDIIVGRKGSDTIRPGNATDKVYADLDDELIGVGDTDRIAYKASFADDTDVLALSWLGPASVKDDADAGFGGPKSVGDVSDGMDPFIGIVRGVSDFDPPPSAGYVGEDEGSDLVSRGEVGLFPAGGDF